MKKYPSTLTLLVLSYFALAGAELSAQTADSSPDAIVNPAPADTFQPSVQWTTGPGANNHFYFLTSAASNWTAAEAQAVAMGGHLASINSANEENFLITSYLGDSSPYATKPLWIGLTDVANGLGSKKYTNWTTGEALTYTNWNDPSEPNNLNDSEDYVAFNWHYSFGETDVKGTWDDVPLNGTTANNGGNNARALGPYYGLVEVVPEPATNALLGVGMLLGLGWVWRRKAARAA